MVTNTASITLKLKIYVLVVLSQLIIGYTKAQGTSFSIEVRAEVVDNLQLLTIRDIDLISPSLQGNLIIVDPATSSFAGHFKILGSPNKTIRINYIMTEALMEQNEGLGIVQTVYSMTTAFDDIQAASLLLTQGTADISLGPKGVVFLWLGAVFDISKATQGNYLSQFVLEFEYL